MRRSKSSSKSVVGVEVEVGVEVGGRGWKVEWIGFDDSPGAVVVVVAVIVAGSSSSSSSSSGVVVD